MADRIQAQDEWALVIELHYLASARMSAVKAVKSWMDGDVGDERDADDDNDDDYQGEEPDDDDVVQWGWVEPRP